MADKDFGDMLWGNIKKIRSQSDEQFTRWVLEARSDFLRLRLRQEPALRRIYIDAADNVAEEVRALASRKRTLQRSHLEALEKTLRGEAERINADVSERLRADMMQAVEAGARPLNEQLLRALGEAKAPLDSLKLQHGFGDINRAAVEALWSRTHKGMMLSDRIWEQGNKARETMRSIIWEGTARGRDAVKVARDLEQYVRKGRATLARDYPNMMERMGEKRIPGDLCYEALRLARTEMSNAFREGTYAAGRTNPSYKGIRWLLSGSHPVADICDDFAEANLYGLGPGGYPEGEEPPLPHPNCLCSVAPIVEDTRRFATRIIEWIDDPNSHPDLEEWYNEVYRPMQGMGPVAAPQAPQTEPDMAELLARQYSEKYLGAGCDEVFHSTAALYREEYEEKIDDEAREALMDYCTDGYWSMNDWLRTDGNPQQDLSPARKEKMETLIATIRQLEVQEDVVVMRGASTHLLGGLAWDDLEPGDDLIEKGFMSASLREEVAREFAWFQDEHERLILRIKVPKGTSALMVDVAADVAWENEVLFPPGARLRILDKHEESGGWKVIEGMIFND